jgi:hypothetical protein
LGWNSRWRERVRDRGRGGLKRANPMKDGRWKMKDEKNAQILSSIVSPSSVFSLCLSPFWS